MLVLDIGAYAADAAILGTYALLSLTGRNRLFHLANTLGCVPLIAVEVEQRAWPVLPVTAAFGLIGLIGLVRRGR